MGKPSVYFKPMLLQDSPSIFDLFLLFVLDFGSIIMLATGRLDLVLIFFRSRGVDAVSMLVFPISTPSTTNNYFSKTSRGTDKSDPTLLHTK